MIQKKSTDWTPLEARSGRWQDTPLGRVALQLREFEALAGQVAFFESERRSLADRASQQYEFPSRPLDPEKWAEQERQERHPRFGGPEIHAASDADGSTTKDLGYKWKLVAEAAADVWGAFEQLEHAFDQLARCSDAAFQVDGKSVTDWMNPVRADVMRVRDLVVRRGSDHHPADANEVSDADKVGLQRLRETLLMQAEAAEAVAKTEAAKIDGVKGAVRETATIPETARAIAAVIDKNPGLIAKEIAVKVRVSEETVRRHCSDHLRPRGYTNPGGRQGYYPPKSQGST